MDIDVYRIGGEIAAWGARVAGAAEEGLRGADWGVLGSYAGLLGLAVFSIYAGAHGSLPVSGVLVPRWGADAVQRVKVEKKEKTDEAEDEEVMEFLSAEDAWLFPIVSRP